MLNYDILRRASVDTHMFISNLDKQITQAKSEEEKRRVLEAKSASIQKSMTDISTLRKASEVILQTAKKEYADFKDKRMDIISDTATSYLREIFPERQFKVKLSYLLHRGVNSRIRLYDKAGNERLIHMTEGKFLQSLVSYAASVGMLQEMGMDKLYLDESFAVSDPENMSQVEKLFGALLPYITQMWMVEQTSNGYRNLPRREIHLKYDPINDRAYPPEYKDFGDPDDLQQEDTGIELDVEFLFDDEVDSDEDTVDDEEE